MCNGVKKNGNNFDSIIGSFSHTLKSTIRQERLNQDHNHAAHCGMIFDNLLISLKNQRETLIFTSDECYSSVLEKSAHRIICKPK